MPLNTTAQLRQFIDVPSGTGDDWLSLLADKVECELTEWAGGELPEDGMQLSVYRVAHAQLVELDLQFDQRATEDFAEREVEYRSYQEMRTARLSFIRWRDTSG